VYQSKHRWSPVRLKAGVLGHAERNPCRSSGRIMEW
jgi:hypothetical protein